MFALRWTVQGAPSDTRFVRAKTSSAMRGLPDVIVVKACRGATRASWCWRRGPPRGPRQPQRRLPQRRHHVVRIKPETRCVSGPSRRSSKLPHPSAAQPEGPAAPAEHTIYRRLEVSSRADETVVVDLKRVLRLIAKSARRLLALPLQELARVVELLLANIPAARRDLPARSAGDLVPSVSRLRDGTTGLMNTRSARP